MIRSIRHDSYLARQVAQDSDIWELFICTEGHELTIGTIVVKEKIARYHDNRIFAHPINQLLNLAHLMYMIECSYHMNRFRNKFTGGEDDRTN